MNIFDYIFLTILRRPLTALVLILLICLIASMGLQKLTYTSDFRVYFSDENPELRAFKDMEHEFTGQDNIAFLLHHPQKSIYTTEGLTLIDRLTKDSWLIPYSQRVDSIRNSQRYKSNDDEIVSLNLYESEELSQSNIGPLVESRILKNDLIINRLIDKEGQYALVNVIVSIPEQASQASEEIMKATDAKIREMRDQFPSWQIKRVGSVPSNSTMGYAIEHDIKHLVIIAYIVMVVIMFVLLRSFTAIITISVLIAISVLITMGIFGWLGYQLSPPSGFVPTAVMTIAVADAVHVLTTYFHQRRRGIGSKDAMRESLLVNLIPISITSITTIIGVLCLNASDSPPYQDMGNMIAVGVFIAWIMTLVFLPAWIIILPDTKSFRRQNAEVRMQLLSHYVQKYSISSFSITLFVIMMACWGISKVSITERWHNYLDETYEVRQAIDQLSKSIGGLHAYYFIADSQAENGIANHEFMQQVDQFCSWLRLQQAVVQVACITDSIKQLHQEMNGGDPLYYRIPNSTPASAQLLLLYQLSLPNGLSTDQQLNFEQSKTRIQVNVRQSDSAELLTLAAEFSDWANQNVPMLNIYTATGLDYVFAHLTHRNINGMINGTLLALLLITVIMLFALKNIRQGLLSIIPNVLPAIVAYGIWGITNGFLDTATSVVACLALGIIVDDTVHFMFKYKYARTTLGFNVNQSVDYTFTTVGFALIVTSAILCSGFLILGFSMFHPSRDMGMLLVITLLSALIIDLMLLPNLLIKLDNRQLLGFKRNKLEHSNHQTRPDDATPSNIN